jgi:hypothetical protein
VKALLWLIFAAWGFYLWYGVHYATFAMPCTATSALPRNHRVVASDLECASEGAAARYLGMYAGRDIAAKAPIHLSALVDAPALRIVPGEVVFQVNRPNSVPAAADAGTRLTLRTPAQPAIPARLVAVICGAQDGGTCRPIVAVREEFVSALTTAAPATIEVAVEASQPPQPPPAPKQPPAPPATDSIGQQPAKGRAGAQEGT